MTNLKQIQKTIQSFALYFDGKQISDEKAGNGAKKIQEALAKNADWLNDSERYKKYSTTFYVNLVEAFFPQKKVEFKKEKYIASLKKETAEAKGIFDISYLKIQDKSVAEMLQGYLKDYDDALKMDGKGQSRSILEGARSMLNKFAKHHDLGGNLTAIVDGHYAF